MVGCEVGEVVRASACRPRLSHGEDTGSEMEGQGGQAVEQVSRQFQQGALINDLWLEDRLVGWGGVGGAQLLSRDQLFVTPQTTAC